MITVGLTGGIACGKSTVARMLRERGVPVLDLDRVAREVVAPGEPALDEIAARWPDVVKEGVLDRKALGAVVVADPEARRVLEGITHPRIWARTEAWLAAQDAPVVAVEAALMVETGSWRRYDRLLVVSCSPDVQRARLMAREGYDAATADRWLAAQMPMAEKERVAHAVVRNDGTEEALRTALDEAWRKIVGEA
ncbi:MAG: dephospho-CoA kinase [Myxococcota bacterium]